MNLDLIIRVHASRDEGVVQRRWLGNSGDAELRGAARLAHVFERVAACVEIKILRHVRHRVKLHAIDATPARWRGDAGASPLDRASTAASSPRNDFYTGRDALVPLLVVPPPDLDALI